VRPRLKPALRPVWRGDGLLQLGVDPDRAVVLSGVDSARARLLQALDGSLDERGVRREAARLGLGPRETDQLLALLLREGAAEDAGAGSAALLRLPLAERDRLGPDLAALSVAHRTRDGGRGVLARRQRASVVVHGAGRVGAALAALLAAAGVARVQVEDTGQVRPGDLAPGGHRSDALGLSRRTAALGLLRAAAPSVRSGGSRSAADVVVLTGETPADPVLQRELVRGGVVHLVVELREASAVVGPLVLPGRSSCRRCHDIARSERDPAWPRVAAQLAGRSPTESLDVALAALVAATAALQVLAHVDGGPSPPTVDGTLELRLPGGEVRRRSWSPHPACGCGWAEVG
jgi:hypothetical protein